jgi:hypothetical protein
VKNKKQNSPGKYLFALGKPVNFELARQGASRMAATRQVDMERLPLVMNSGRASFEEVTHHQRTAADEIVLSTHILHPMNNDITTCQYQAFVPQSQRRGRRRQS